MEQRWSYIKKESTVVAGEGGELSGKFSGGVIIFCCGGIFCGFLAKLTESVSS